MRLVHFLQYCGYRSAAAVASAAPPRLTYGLAAAAARAFFVLGLSRTRYALTNLGIALPDRSPEEVRRVARASFVHFAWTLVDTMRMGGWSEDDLEERIRVVGKEHLDAALALGKGVILLGLHTGSFELGAPLAPRKLGPVAWYSRPLKNEFIDRRFSSIMTRTGCSLIDPRGGTGKGLGVLRSGGMVGVLNDQFIREGRGGLVVPFFGVPSCTAPGVAILALRSGAPVLPIYMTRDSIERHTATVEPPVEFERIGDLRSNVVTATTAFNRAYERIILRNPEQYFWMARRFRDGSDTGNDPY